MRRFVFAVCLFVFAVTSAFAQQSSQTASIRDRIDNRSLPSIALPWDDGILNRGGNWWDDSIPYNERIATHDLWWHYLSKGLQLTPEGYQLIGDLPRMIAIRDELLSINPNLILLFDLRQSYASPDRYSEDWFGWLRDANGNPVRRGNDYLIDFRLPEVQDVIAQRAGAIAKSGLYDGIVFDAWAENYVVLYDETTVPYYEYERTPQYQLDLEVERQALISILQKIRAVVPDDFLILCNNNRNPLPLSAPYINGGFMETFPNTREEGYTRADIIDIENNLIWYEANVREPKINLLRGFGIGAEPPDSPRNRQWMRLFTTMSLTLSNGYSLYTIGTKNGQKGYQKHIWHPFWDADLGQPIGPITQRYQDIEGLYIREFTNGWAVYNRSRTEQAILLPQPTIAMSSNKKDMIHILPDLDGEIYLKTPNPADVNGDGRINILDLVLVAKNFGKTKPDLNGDGIVNIFDLVLVAKQFD